MKIARIVPGWLTGLFGENASAQDRIATIEGWVQIVNDKLVAARQGGMTCETISEKGKTQLKMTLDQQGHQDVFFIGLTRKGYDCYITNESPLAQTGNRFDHYNVTTNHIFDFFAGALEEVSPEGSIIPAVINEIEASLKRRKPSKGALAPQALVQPALVHTS